VAKLRAWVADGAHRRDRDGDGRYEHAGAVRILDVGRKVRQAYSKRYCGGGVRSRCRSALRAALAASLDDSVNTLYRDAQCAEAGKPFDQACLDSISFRATGAVTQPMIGWQNRPTYQQVVEVQGHRPR